MIESKNLFLKSFTTKDITDDYVAWLNNKYITKYSNQKFLKHSKKTCQEYLKSFANSSNLFFSINRKIDKKKIGTMTAYISKFHNTADIGILIGDKDVWGKGFGYEAWYIFCEYLFNDKKIRKITAGTVKSNRGMINVIKKYKMSLDGIRKRQLIFNGKFEDEIKFCKFSNK